MYLPPSVPIVATLAQAPGGRAGVRHTLRIMRGLIDEYKTDPDMISTAVSLVFLHPEKHEAREVGALFQFVQRNIRYTRDVYGVETVANPLITLARKVGDCDDKTTLFCTLCESIGYPTRLVMAGYQSADFEHVYCQVFADGNWLDADTTENSPLGVAPPSPVVLFVEN